MEVYTQASLEQPARHPLTDAENVQADPWHPWQYYSGNHLDISFLVLPPGMHPGLPGPRSVQHPASPRRLTSLALLSAQARISAVGGCLPSRLPRRTLALCPNNNQQPYRRGVGASCRPTSTVRFHSVTRTSNRYAGCTHIPDPREPSKEDLQQPAKSRRRLCRRCRLHDSFILSLSPYVL